MYHIYMESAVSLSLYFCECQFRPLLFPHRNSRLALNPCERVETRSSHRIVGLWRSRLGWVCPHSPGRIRIIYYQDAKSMYILVRAPSGLCCCRSDFNRRLIIRVTSPKIPRYSITIARDFCQPTKSTFLQFVVSFCRSQPQAQNSEPQFHRSA